MCGDFPAEFLLKLIKSASFFVSEPKSAGTSSRAQRKMALTLLQWGWIFGGIFGLASCIESFRIIYLHIKRFYEPGVQVFAVRIVAMVPVIMRELSFELLFSRCTLSDHICRCYFSKKPFI